MKIGILTETCSICHFELFFYLLLMVPKIVIREFAVVNKFVSVTVVCIASVCVADTNAVDVSG